MKEAKCLKCGAPDGECYHTLAILPPADQSTEPAITSESGEVPERIWLQRCPDGSLSNYIWKKGDYEYARIRAGSQPQTEIRRQALDEAARVVCSFCKDGIPVEFTCETYRHHLVGETPWVVCRAERIRALASSAPPANAVKDASMRAAKRIYAEAGIGTLENAKRIVAIIESELHAALTTEPKKAKDK